MLVKRAAFGLFFWAVLSLVLIAYLISSYTSGHILRLYQEDRNAYALFSMGAIISLGLCLGMLSGKVTELFGLEIEKVEHFEG